MENLGAPQPEQQEMPFAVVQGNPVVELPKDLYIPPDALEVFLDAFEGPLDLLLYLIKRQNLDILDIPIAAITRQYMEYIDLMQGLRLELAAEYLVMAAMLAEIKSRMLLPRSSSGDGEDDEDPRAELIRRLQEYERFKTAAGDLEALPHLGRDVFQAQGDFPDRQGNRPLPSVELKDLLLAFYEVMRRADMFTHHQVEREPLSVRERMVSILDQLGDGLFVPFSQLFRFSEGKMGAVVSFLAILELAKESLLEIVQSEPMAIIHVRRTPETEGATA
ncbi:MAG: segregation/condensation protein A [Chromatiales bacterium]|nr:segregation/condensation protein A [Chromatiales bacterium]